jgi:chaperonin GroES
MNLKPLFDRVVVQGIQDKTPSGIVIPDTVDKDKPKKGQIMAVGNGKMSDSGKRIPLTVKVGDKVVFKEYSPEEVKVEGKEYLIIKEEDILAIIK